MKSKGLVNAKVHAVLSTYPKGLLSYRVFITFDNLVTGIDNFIFFQLRKLFSGLLSSKYESIPLILYMMFSSPFFEGDDIAYILNRFIFLDNFISTIVSIIIIPIQ